MFGSRRSHLFLSIRDVVFGHSFHEMTVRAQSFGGIGASPYSGHVPPHPIPSSRMQSVALLCLRDTWRHREHETVGAEIRIPCPGEPSHLAEISLYDFISRCAGSSVLDRDVFMEKTETGSLPHLPHPVGDLEAVLDPSALWVTGATEA